MRWVTDVVCAGRGCHGADQDVHRSGQPERRGRPRGPRPARGRVPQFKRHRSGSTRASGALGRGWLPVRTAVDTGLESRASCVHCGVPELPEMQALAERLDALLAGAVLLRADLLGSHPSRRITPRLTLSCITDSSRYAGERSTWCGSLMTETGSCCTCHKRVDWTSSNRRSRRGPVAPQFASRSVRTPPASRGLVSASRP